MPLNHDTQVTKFADLVQGRFTHFFVTTGLFLIADTMYNDAFPKTALEAVLKTVTRRICRAAKEYTYSYLEFRLPAESPAAKMALAEMQVYDEKPEAYMLRVFEDRRRLLQKK